ncbi:MAG: homocysteine S-methyltransferase family protein [Ruminococcaceae bacterium]|jgi:5-methyltetrahydrofolate--homocysteine methyltransferase|nr:homocysteine S-methyltransferase family protein [Oscillospiraceae bacterium]
MKQGITLMDGAVGTSLWAKAEANGVKKDPVWRYNLEHPELVAELTADYADAGAEIILANTFGANGPAVKRSSPYTAPEVVSAGVRIAKKTLRGSGRRIALSAGPLTAMLEPYGDMTEEEAGEIYYEMLEAGMKEGPDLILLQTFMDLTMLRVAAVEAKKFGVPVFCCLTFEKRGKTMMGNSVEDMIEELEPVGIDAIGMNCSLGPDLAVPVIREFVGKTSLPLIFKPNAGKPILAPDGSTATAYSAKVFADDVMPALDFVDYVGGCCGADASYVRELAGRLGR